MNWKISRFYIFNSNASQTRNIFNAILCGNFSSIFDHYYFWTSVGWVVSTKIIFNKTRIRVQTITELTTVKSADTHGCTFSAGWIVFYTNLLINVRRKSCFQRTIQIWEYGKQSIRYEHWDKRKLYRKFLQIGDSGELRGHKFCKN